MTTRNPVRTALVKTVHVFNGNYGGVMQAYALQQVLSSLDVAATTDTSKGPAMSSRAKGLARPLIQRAAALPRVNARLAHHVDDAALNGFVHERLNTIDMYGWRPGGAHASRWDALITGSDQVWQPRYTDVEANLFDFAVDFVGPKIAYAASFGAADPAEWSPDLLVRTRDLAGRLSALSVRERSAVKLCRDHWDLDAVQVLDPTMLLTREHYESIIDDRAGAWLPQPDPYVFDYVLDRSSAPEDALDRVADRMSLRRVSGLRQAAGPKPSIASWLRGFRDAQLVVTDSFHGTVFSILFETPFLSVANHARGVDRFKSVLEAVGLQDRLVGSADDLSGLDAPIEWRAVRERLDHERTTSREFLATALGSAA